MGLPGTWPSPVDGCGLWPLSSPACRLIARTQSPSARGANLSPCCRTPPSTPRPRRHGGQALSSLPWALAAGGLPPAVLSALGGHGPSSWSAMDSGLGAPAPWAPLWLSFSSRPRPLRVWLWRGSIGDARSFSPGRCPRGVGAGGWGLAWLPWRGRCPEGPARRGPDCPRPGCHERPFTAQGAGLQTRPPPECDSSPWG